ncbi:MAG: proteasome subunit alpha [Acidimicrobiia bacterium]|nr:proteasome subunit alpha [Acidimicrobiia bacterium]
MTIPFYVPPEQLVRDKAEYARKGIARGRSIVALSYDEGILILAENPSTTLRKISEVYDRIAFAGAGRFNEFETLRKAGIRQADITGYMYSRNDVNARGLAAAFSQTLGAVFSHEPKPYEVEILLAEVGPAPGDRALFKVSYDGTVYAETDLVAIGGKADDLTTQLREGWRENLTLEEATTLGAESFREIEGRDSEGWEAAVLSLDNGRRAFRRIEV